MLGDETEMKGIKRDAETYEGKKSSESKKICEGKKSYEVKGK